MRNIFEDITGRASDNLRLWIRRGTHWSFASHELSIFIVIVIVVVFVLQFTREEDACVNVWDRIQRYNNEWIRDGGRIYGKRGWPLLIYSIIRDRKNRESLRLPLNPKIKSRFPKTQGCFAFLLEKKIKLASFPFTVGKEKEIKLKLVAQNCV